MAITWINYHDAPGNRISDAIEISHWLDVHTFHSSRLIYIIKSVCIVYQNCFCIKSRVVAKTLTSYYDALMTSWPTKKTQKVKLITKLFAYIWKRIKPSNIVILKIMPKVFFLTQTVFWAVFFLVKTALIELNLLYNPLLLDIALKYVSLVVYFVTSNNSNEL